MFRRFTTLVFAVALLAVGIPTAALGAPSPERAEPDQRCYGVQGHGDTYFDLSVGGFVGGGVARVGGETQRFGVTVYANPATGMSSHIIEFSQGTVVTEEPIVTKPTDDPMVLQLLSRPKVVFGGTGSLHLLPGSTLTLMDLGDPIGVVPVAASWDIRGQVCFDA